MCSIVGEEEQTMVIKTRCFGEVNIGDEKIITFDNGLFGFEDYKKFTILYNSETETEKRISWLQSVEEPALAFPMISPLVVDETYNPSVQDEVLASLEELTEENIAMFLIITVPSDITKMSANLKAPIIINSDNRKGVQVVADNQEYVVKYGIYDIFKNKEGQPC